jgi:hypothetical protein
LSDSISVVDNSLTIPLAEMKQRLGHFSLFCAVFLSPFLAPCAPPELIFFLLIVVATAPVTLRSIQPAMVLGTLLQLVQFGQRDDENNIFPTFAGAATTNANSVAESSSCPMTAEVDDLVVVEGIALPPTRILADDGMPLYRNGHGIRSIPFLGMNVKVYVAHLYSRRSLNQENALALIESNSVNAKAFSPSNRIDGSSTNSNEGNKTYYHHHHNPLHFDFTFLRRVGQSRVVSAWTQQLEHSVTHRYDGYEQDRDRFIQLFSTGPIENGGTQTVQLVGDETRIIDQGCHKGTIVGREFQKSFLSMWVGPKAVGEDLKRNLFQGHGQTDCGVEVETGKTAMARDNEMVEAIPVAA